MTHTYDSHLGLTCDSHYEKLLLLIAVILISGRTITADPAKSFPSLCFPFSGFLFKSSSFSLGDLLDSLRFGAFSGYFFQQDSSKWPSNLQCVHFSLLRCEPVGAPPPFLVLLSHRGFLVRGTDHIHLLLLSGQLPQLERWPAIRP